jgi:hypothetical protein
VFDADNHYYEAVDAFTRHLDPALGRRIVQWAEIDGRKYQVIGGKVNHAVVNPTFDPIAKAGAMSEYFRGNASGKSPMEYLREREPIRAEYRDRDARLQVMDEQGVVQHTESAPDRGCSGRGLGPPSWIDGRPPVDPPATSVAHLARTRLLLPTLIPCDTPE